MNSLNIFDDTKSQGSTVIQNPPFPHLRVAARRERPRSPPCPSPNESDEDVFRISGDGVASVSDALASHLFAVAIAGVEGAEIEDDGSESACKSAIDSSEEDLAEASWREDESLKHLR